MRITSVFLIIVFSLLTNGFATDKMVYEFRVNLDPVNISVCDEGMFLKREGHENVFLDNLHHDEKGYFSICKCVLVCSNCHKELGMDPKICDTCGSMDFDFMGPGMNKESEHLTVQAVLCNYLKERLVWDGNSLLCGEIDISGSCDSKGNQSATVEITEESDNGKFSGGAKGTVQKDNEGNVNYKVEGGISFDF